MDKTFLILGGYGNAGKLIAEYLLKETKKVRLILAGRNLDKAKILADSLNQQFGSQRVFAQCVDAANSQNLLEAFTKVDLVVVASSSSEYVKNVAEAALSARIDYLDIQYSTEKINLLKSMVNEIEQAGCCFITDGGFHPGLPAVLVRYAALRFDRLEKAHVGSVIKIDWQRLTFSDVTVDELVKEFKDFRMSYFKEGQWIKARWQDNKKFDFGSEFGMQMGMPMLLEEMLSLPMVCPSLRETGFYVGGFNWFVDYLVMPLGWLALSVWQKMTIKPIGSLLLWGLKTFSKPPYATILLMEASGVKNSQSASLRVKVSHRDGYVLTAVPVVATLLQYLNGGIKKPGLWLQANIVEPEHMLRDMEKMEVQVVIEEMK